MLRLILCLSGLVPLLILSGCAPSVRYAARPVPGQRETGREIFYTGQVLNGIASYYAEEFHGRKTANGETYDMYDKTAAHLYLPFDTIVRVTNTANGRAVLVRINDRGPFKADRIIDLSYQAAREIGLIAEGTARVRVEIIKLGR